MRLVDLLSALDSAQVLEVPDVTVTGITADSRTVKPGDVFVCIPGARVDAHQFIPDAVRRGAVAVVSQRPCPVPKGVGAVVVADPRHALSALADRFYGSPSCTLKMVGVTGTNGKTTTAFLVEAIARAGGRTMGVIGTAGMMLGTEELEGKAGYTTPEPQTIHRLLATMLRRGAWGAVMEVSSHALEQRRTDHCRFDVEPAVVGAALLQGVAGDLHHGAPGPAPQHRGQQPVDGLRLGRGVPRLALQLLRAEHHAGRADHAHGAAPGPCDGLDQEGGRGLAVGAGDAHHLQCAGGGTVEAVRQSAQGVPGIGHHHGAHALGHRAGPLAHDGDRPAPDSVGDELVRIHPRTGDADEHVARLHRARVRGDAGDRDVGDLQHLGRVQGRQQIDESQRQSLLHMTALMS